MKLILVNGLFTEQTDAKNGEKQGETLEKLKYFLG